MIFPKEAQEFTGIGLGVLIPEKCVVSEQINGSYELQMTHPRDNTGKWKRIETQRIIFASTPDGMQPFRIYRITPEKDRISVYARHIFYDMLDTICYGKRLTGTAQQWMKDMPFTFAFPMPFVFGTDIDSDTRETASYDGENTVEILTAKTNSFVALFGGEVIRDKFNVFFAKKRGQDIGYKISYGKNLKGLTVDEDLTNVITHIEARGEYQTNVGGESQTETARVTVVSPRVNDYVYPKMDFITFNDTADKDVMTKRIKKMFDDGLDLPNLNVRVDFVQLEKLEQYKKYKFLQKLHIGDTVTVYHEKMNFNKKLRMIDYNWNCITNEYEKIQFGDLKDTLANSVTQSATKGVDALKVAEGAKTSTNNIASLISGNVSITNNFLYLPVDNADYTKAQKIYRLGKNGMEYSTTGYNGVFDVLVDGSAKG